MLTSNKDYSNLRPNKKDKSWQKGAFAVRLRFTLKYNSKDRAISKFYAQLLHAVMSPSIKNIQEFVRFVYIYTYLIDQTNTSSALSRQDS